jgi:hypothetical protein
VAVNKELDTLRSECLDCTAIGRYNIALCIACAMLTSLLRLVSKILHEYLTHYGNFDLESVAGTCGDLWPGLFFAYSSFCFFF